MQFELYEAGGGAGLLKTKEENEDLGLGALNFYMLIRHLGQMFSIQNIWNSAT